MILGAVFGRTNISDPLPQKCLDLTRELNDYIIDMHRTVLCPDIISDYTFATPKRKQLCTHLVFDIIDGFALIMERECNITRI